ncbi:hypothetical protein [Calothrix sp. PCC 7507]|uniref:hypothetical protein n=1 Tax=Calothrix sp. PCC 7507 TaxID=99598 RepID=UPI00029F158E|nr:hypothetical protein [Calothrix sp. PCC 7507]AFY35397.1 hypothetical protein Cal7507_5051 [Calothrix sp. PCC 7507]
MAKQALAAEILSNQNWMQETEAAQQLIQNHQFQEQVFQISQNIFTYLNTRHNLQQICNIQGDYYPYYKPRYLYAGGAWGVLREIVANQIKQILKLG